MAGLHEHARILIAQTAARLMAEHGIRDRGLAKRKALRQLGLPPGHTLPGNEEIDQALRDYRALFVDSGQDEVLQGLRSQAVQAMQDLKAFDPVLVGGVASGAITLHSDIELEIGDDRAKEFEQFLMREDIAYDSTDRHGTPLFILYAEPANVQVRFVFEARKGQRRRDDVRLSLNQVTRLLQPPAMAEPAQTD